MVKESLGNIVLCGGTFPPEQDVQGTFQWCRSPLELEVTPGTGGLVVIEGSSPLSNHLSVITPQGGFSLQLSPNQNLKIRIPLAPCERSVRVALHFSDRLDLLEDSRPLAFRLRSVEWQASLRTSPVKEHSLPKRGLPEGLVATIFSEGWLRMHTQRLGDRTFHVSGILAAPLSRRENAFLTVNGVPAQNIEYGLFNPGYAYLGPCAFEGTIDIDPDTSVTHFSSCFASDGVPATPWYQDWYLPAPSPLPLPDQDNMRRIGAGERDWFLFAGASFVYKLPQVITRCAQDRTLANCSILDWGCGCGRLTRHLLDLGCKDVMGIDIDPVNIDWCRKHLPASFELVSPDLPTHLPERTFDLIIGHSVFTHLGELDQFLWLCELNRLLRKGGIAVVTVMGNRSAAIEQFEQSQYDELRKNGILDVGWQNDGVDSQKPGFYRRVFHTIDYLLKQWSAFFCIEAILEGYSDHQTAIVLRKI